MIKLNTARSYLESQDLQVSTEAAAALAFFLDDRGRAIGERAGQLVRDENEARVIQGLEPRKRITAEDVRRAVGP